MIKAAHGTHVPPEEHAVAIKVFFIAGLTIVPTVIMLCTFPLCPESPKYILINQGKDVAAQQGNADAMFPEIKITNTRLGAERRIYVPITGNISLLF